jgi:hypothetical protein
VKISDLTKRIVLTLLHLRFWDLYFMLCANIFYDGSFLRESTSSIWAACDGSYCYLCISNVTYRPITWSNGEFMFTLPVSVSIHIIYPRNYEYWTAFNWICYYGAFCNSWLNLILDFVGPLKPHIAWSNSVPLLVPSKVVQLTNNWHIAQNTDL